MAPAPMAFVGVDNRTHVAAYQSAMDSEAHDMPSQKQGEEEIELSRW